MTISSTDPSPIDDQRVTEAPVRPHRTITWPFDFAFQEERFFLILSVFIGIFSALAVVCFRLAIEWFRLKMLGPRLTPSGPHVIIAPTLVGLLVAVLVLHVFPAVRGSGVNQTKAALYIYDGYIPFRTAIGKFITAALAIGSGQSLGPEDPSLQIGAGLASALGRRLKLSRDKLRLVARRWAPRQAWRPPLTPLSPPSCL